MIRLAIVVEGPTEQEFVRNVLAGHLLGRDMAVVPTLVGSNGGDVTIERLSSGMVRLFYPFDFVSSLVDFYGFRDRNGATVDDLENRINAAVDLKIARSWDRSRVFAYVQQYEFEGLLFSDVNAFAALPGVADSIVPALAAIRGQFPSPEDINDGPDTAPSKRIANLITGYSKVVDGLRVADVIGLDTIRAQCPRFSRWVARLEASGNPSVAP